MALDTVLKAVLRNWWLIVLTTLLTVASTAFFAFRQAPIYSAAATIELRPNPELDQANQVTNAVQAIQNKVVVNTLARKATTSIVEEQVANRLQVPTKALSDANLTAAVLPDTGLIEVRAQSTSPTLAAAIANTTAQVMTTEVMASILKADIIDLAVPPTTPIGSGRTRSVSLGFAFGLILGVVLALIEYFIFTFRETHGLPAPRLRHLGGGYGRRRTQLGASADAAHALPEESSSRGEPVLTGTGVRHEASASREPASPLEAMSVLSPSESTTVFADQNRRNGAGIEH